MNLSLLISKYSWAIVIVGVIAWVTYMSLKKPTNANGKNPDNLSRLGLAIEKAKPIFENFKRNVSETYGDNKEAKPSEEKKEEEKKQEPKKEPFKLPEKEEIIKDIDF